MSHTLITIDPGAKGGFAWLDADGNPQCAPMPDTEGDVLDLVRDLRTLAGSPKMIAMLEEVGGYCGGGGQPGSAMFKFGASFGFLKGVLMAHAIRIELVRPQKWQKHFGLGTVKSSGGKTAWKNKLKAEAQRRFPTCDVTLKTADALLILDYANSLKV